MKTLIRTTGLALIAASTLVLAQPATAAPPQALLIAPPQPGFAQPLPKFGFRSYNLSGVGEVVTYVRWGSLAWQLGLQNGDVIRSLNFFELTYHGAWNDALRYALSTGNRVHLEIIDRNTGFVAQREVYFNGYGGTPYVVGYPGPNTSHLVGGNHCHGTPYGYPSGPVTYKSQVGPQLKNKSKNNSGGISLQQIAKMFKKD